MKVAKQHLHHCTEAKNRVAIYLWPKFEMFNSTYEHHKATLVQILIECVDQLFLQMIELVHQSCLSPESTKLTWQVHKNSVKIPFWFVLDLFSSVSVILLKCTNSNFKNITVDRNYKRFFHVFGGKWAHLSLGSG